MSIARQLGKQAASAVVVKGNPKYLDNPNAAKFYDAIEAALKAKGYDVSFDAGEPYTEPAKADLWVGHSRGAERLRFAPEGTRTVALGAKGGINHPDDKAIEGGTDPDDTHFTLTPEMVAALSKSANTNRYTNAQLYDAFSNVETKGLTGTNKFIRTKIRPPQGSSVYGPVQLGKGLITDYMKKPDLFNPGEQAYLQAMQDQAKDFLRHGNMKGKLKDYNPVYDYGGTGRLGQTPTQRARYRSVSEKIIGDLYKKHDYNLDSLIKRWRDKSKAEAPGYYKEIYQGLGRK